MDTQSSKKQKRHTMKVVERRSGLSSDLIRVWERRYRAITPARTETNRRLYSDEDIERLLLLREVMQYGHTISQVANLSAVSLQKLLENERANPIPLPPGEVREDPDDLLVRAMQAVGRQDEAALEDCLKRALLSYGGSGMLMKFVAPLIERIGSAWHAGKISPAHEHVATVVIRDFLLRTVRGYSTPATAPTLVVSTPAGQLHELGAAITAAAAAHAGWRVRYIGASLPASDIAATALRHHAKAIALSIVYPPDDPDLGDDLRRLPDYLGDSGAELIFGGRCARSYGKAIADAGGVICDGLDEFLAKLERLRQPK